MVSNQQRRSEYQSDPGLLSNIFGYGGEQVQFLLQTQLVPLEQGMPCLNRMGVSVLPTII